MAVSADSTPVPANPPAPASLTANRIGSPYAGVSIFPLPESIQTAEAPSASPVSSGVTLTSKGEAYCLRHGREATERRINRHLALVTALLALLDQADGDENLEPYLAGIDGGPGDDREGGDVLDSGEPSLGWTEMETRYGCSLSASFDCEVDTADDEPSLGAPETIVNPMSWHGMMRTNEGSQTHWARGRGDDDEVVNEDGDLGEQDSGEPIPGGEHGLDELSRHDARTMKVTGYRL